MDTKPIHHKRFVLKIELIQEVDAFRSREDSHGGPGYYPKEIVIARSKKVIAENNLPEILQLAGSKDDIQICDIKELK
jgi:hypothetical protein